MKELRSLALCYINKKICILNQQKLPKEEEWIVSDSPQKMYDIISTLQVRGAPLIGVSAALALADYVEKGADIDEVRDAAKLLKSARPTAVNLAHCVDRQIAALEDCMDLKSIVKVAEEIFFEDCQLSNNIAIAGNDLISDGDNILTHCNTGGLVTTGIGTALGIIKFASKCRKNLHVFVDETRPLLQGARLTAWELHREDISYTLICDNMAASLMRKNKVQKIIVGADRIAKNGDFANKIGTYNLAILAHYMNIPFYVAAPYTTIDPTCEKGENIVIEERDADEVRGLIDQMIWSLSDAPVYNPAFDVTPVELVTAYILDRGIVYPVPGESIIGM